jgi:hypothetical protein
MRPVPRLETRQPRSWPHAPSSTADRGRRIQIVVNPRAGDGLAASFGQRLACHLRTDRYDVQLTSADDPARTRDELLRTGHSPRSLIAIGGDYTLNEMAAVAMEMQVPLLPVPAGFGNIFARNLGYHATIPDVLKLLEHGTVRRIDAGRLGRSVFLDNHAFGFTRRRRRCHTAGCGAICSTGGRQRTRSPAHPCPLSPSRSTGRASPRPR